MGKGATAGAANKVQGLLRRAHRQRRQEQMGTLRFSHPTHLPFASAFESRGRRQHLPQIRTRPQFAHSIFLGFAMGLQGYYCVAFLDLLGTGATNKNISELKYADPEGAARMLAREIAKVRSFREAFNELLEILQKREPAETTSEPHPNSRASRFGNLIKHYTFSDSSIIHCSLNTQQGALVPVKSCFWMLLAVALAQLQELAMGVSFRGGIEVDFAASHSDDGREILGPALSGAVQLEKCKADFPRVAIGKGFHDYLKVHANQDDISQENRLNKTWAKKCIEIISEDSKGILSVDLTASGITPWVGKDLHRKLLDRSVCFARKQIEEHKDKAKISQKYEMLLADLTKRSLDEA
jgi:hypothetical protein